jgi:membrane complex biogenesis BtpA family protein
MATGVAADRGSALRRIFGRPKAAIGVVHCPPFPGAPRHRGASTAEIVAAALADARAYAEGGIHGLIVENHGDIPFLRPADIGPETAAMMAVVTDAVRRETGLPLGINVLANAAIPALAVAKAGGAAFVRVNQWANAYVANEGFVEGDAGLALRYRARIDAGDVAIFADSHVKHGAHAVTADRTIEELTRDLEFFDADAVIATGQRTGDTATPAEIRTVKAATILPVLVGSGVRPDNVGEIMRAADGVIIGSSLKTGGVWWAPVERERVATFMARFEEAAA